MKRGLVGVVGFVALWALTMSVGVAQDVDENPEVRGTPVVDAEEPTIDQPQIAVDNPDSVLPDGVTQLTALQTWQLIAAGIATGLTGLALRWIPMPRAKDKREDARKAVAFGVAVVVALIGAALNGDLDSWQPSVAGFVYIAGISYYCYDKIPGIKPIANKIEGRSSAASSA